MDREAGFYWVLFNEENALTIGEYAPTDAAPWRIVACDVPLDESDVCVIEGPIKPPKTGK